MDINPHDREVEAEPTDASDDLQLAAEGVFHQSSEELSEMLDPYGDNASDFLSENH